MRQTEVADNQQERFSELSWLGGIIDGEGSITLTKVVQRKYKCVHPKIVIANTERVMIEKIVDILKSHNIPFYIRVRPPKQGTSVKRLGMGYLPLTEITVLGYKRLKKFLNLIKPYLISKAYKADLMEQLIDSRLNQLGYNTPYSEKEKNICLEIWKLNGNYAINLKEFIENPQRLHAGPITG